MKEYLCGPVEWWKAFAVVILVLAVFLMPRPADAKELFVNNTGSPACSDSTTRADNNAATPWCTLIRAMRGNTDGNRNTAGNLSEAAQAGDIVYVTSGIYDYSAQAYGRGTGFGHSPLYEPINSGTSDNWITFQASGGAVTLTGNTSGTACHLGTYTESYIKFIGFSINQANIGYRQGNGVVCVRTSNVWIEGFDITGEYIDFGFDDNHTGLMIHGPRSGNCTGEITNITVRNSAFHGFTGASSSNDTGTTIYCAAGLTIENNEYYSNHNGIMSKSGYTGSTNSVIRYNLFRGNNSFGIIFQSVNNTDIYQNVFRDNTGGFLFNENNQPDGSPNNISIVNNTFDNNTYNIGWRGDCPDLNGNYIRNNIGTNSTNIAYSEGTSCQAAANIGSDDIDVNYNVWDYSRYFWANDGGSNVSTYSNWQNSYGQDANSSDSASCLYADEANKDFRLCTGSGTPHASCTAVSPCLEGGANDGMDILDLDNDGSTVDAITIGAYISGNEIIGVGREAVMLPTSPHNVDVQQVQ